MRLVQPRSGIGALSATVFVARTARTPPPTVRPFVATVRRSQPMPGQVPKKPSRSTAIPAGLVPACTSAERMPLTAVTPLAPPLSPVRQSAYTVGMQPVRVALLVLPRMRHPSFPRPTGHKVRRNTTFPEVELCASASVEVTSDLGQHPTMRVCIVTYAGGLQVPSHKFLAARIMEIIISPKNVVAVVSISAGCYGPLRRGEVVVLVTLRGQT